MRAVIQRVSRADVKIDGRVVGEINLGLMILLGVGQNDTEKDAGLLADKIADLRIFSDDQEKMNLSLLDVKGEALVVSQFTLYADTRRGRRPSFIEAAPPDKAKALYEYFVERLRVKGVSKVATGEFQAMMDITLTNSGPVTIVMQSGADDCR